MEIFGIGLTQLIIFLIVILIGLFLLRLVFGLATALVRAVLAIIILGGIVWIAFTLFR